MRRLSLKSEHLTELTAGELGAIAGGNDTKTVLCLTGQYPTLAADCTRVITDLFTGTTTG